jgi:hypothetical protein
MSNETLETFWAAISGSGLLLGNGNAKFWYLVPLIVVISLVYGGTRHEKLSEILAHSVRSAAWLVMFLFFIFVIVWVSGYGVTSDLMTTEDVNLLMASMAWVFGTMWIAGNLFQHHAVMGIACFLTGGLMAFVIGVNQCWNRLVKQNSPAGVLENGDLGRADSKRINDSTAYVSAANEAPMWFPTALMLAALVWAFKSILSR